MTFERWYLYMFTANVFAGLTIIVMALWMFINQAQVPKYFAVMACVNFFSAYVALIALERESG